MHDMWPLTGGCHHAFDCTKYLENVLIVHYFIENVICYFANSNLRKNIEFLVNTQI